MLDEVFERAIYQVVNKTTLPKRKYTPDCGHILPDVGWVVTFFTHKENTSKEGLGTITDKHQALFMNPNRAIAPTIPKDRLKRLNYRSKIVKVEGEQNKFNQMVDSFLAEKQLEGKFKF